MAKKSLKKIGLFGGSFNPIHFGHINSILTVQDKLRLDKVFVIPTSQNPLRDKMVDVTPDQRLEMVNMALKDYSNNILVDDQEIQRGGVSYTIDTVKKYAETYPKAELYLILGIDAFENFDKWKFFTEILNICHLVVTSRPGGHWPTIVEDGSPNLQKLIKTFTPYKIDLVSGKTIQFIGLEDKNISASDVRKKIKLGQRVDRFIPLDVEEYIRKNNIYPQLKQKITDYQEFAKFCAEKLDDKKGFQVKIFDLRKLNTLTEYTLVVSGTSTRHAQTLGETLRDSVKEEYGVNPISIEGLHEGRWVALDYGALIVHIFYDFVRQEYKLEDLWQKGSQIV